MFVEKDWVGRVCSNYSTFTATPMICTDSIDQERATSISYKNWKNVGKQAGFKELFDVSLKNAHKI